VKRTISVDAALRDRRLLGAALGDLASWQTWSIALKGAFGLPLNDAERTIFDAIAGGRNPPARRVRELWAVAGRRSGKTRMAAAISVHIGAIEQHTLAPGEVGYVLLLAASRSQARVAFDYVRGFLDASPILRQQILGITSEEVRLKGNIVIAVHAGSYRTIRGRTLLAVVGDETSFWRDESSAQPDVEIYRACAPALAASRGLWVGISTGYRKIGLLYQRWRDHFGADSDDVLVVQADSATLNPTLDVRMIERAKSSDPEAAETEWGGGFRSDIAAFLDDRAIDDAVDHGRPLELSPRYGISYKSFVDPSGGRHDAFTLCIGHKESDNRFVVDVVRGRAPPFDPHGVVAEYAATLKSYGISTVAGDNYSAAWAETAFQDAGITYQRSEMNKSALYLEALPHFMRGSVSIPDHPKLVRELRLLERRTSRAGKDIVDHGRNGSDDHANALAGMLRALAGSNYESLDWVCGPDDPAPAMMPMGGNGWGHPLLRHSLLRWR
jgi:hypothetical protein